MKKALAGILAGLMVISLAACSGSSKPAATTAAAAPAATQAAAPAAAPAATQAAAPAEKTYNLDLATAFAAEGPCGQALVKLAEEVKERSNGTININIFTDGALGNGNEIIQNLASGDLDMGIVGQEGIDMFGQDFSFMISPFLMKNYDHCKAVCDSEIGKGLWDAYEAAGFKVLAWHFRDVRVMASNKPIQTPADVPGLKLRLPGINTYVETWKQLGAVPTTVPMSELYTALQTGVAEACEGGYEQMVTLKCYEVQKYIINTEHEFEQDMIAINAKLYEEMSDNQKQIIAECSKKWMDWANDLSAESREDYKKQCIEGGMEYMDFDIAPFEEALSQYYKDKFGTTWTKYTYDQVMSYAK